MALRMLGVYEHKRSSPYPGHCTILVETKRHNCVQFHIKNLPKAKPIVTKVIILWERLTSKMNRGVLVL